MQSADVSTTPGGEPEKAGAGMRALAVVGALVLAFVAAVMIMVAVDLSDAPLLEDCNILVDDECYAGSSTEKAIGVIGSFICGGAAALAALLALAFAFRGRGGRPVLIATAVAIVAGAIALIIG